MPVKLFAAMFAALVLGALPAAAQLTPEERANRHIVRITGGAAEGAGIIFGRAGDAVLIMTARHVVRDEGARSGSGEISVEFRAAPGEPARAMVEPSESDRLDFAVLRAVAPPHALNGVDFNLLGNLEQVARGQQMHPVGHLSDRNTWYSPVQPVFLRGRTGDLLSFESLAGKSTGLSGGGLFDAQWLLVGMIFQDAPPETLALSIDAAIAQLRTWRYDVALKRPAQQTTVQTQDFRNTADNVIFAPPLGWMQQRGADGTIVLTTERSFNARIVILPGRPLDRSFEDMFDADLQSLNPTSLTTQVRTIQTQEGFRARFVEGTIMRDVGGITNPQPMPFRFLYMACDPVGRYESFLYLNDQYSFEADRAAVNKFVESLDYRNSVEERRRRPPGRR